ncbi:Protein CBG25976 [Caenorhabditis briggsae]|uniref:Protein CBG25976 n=1 Tax=Caenorhabditis briggsae TaxID=6238 RepID=B6IKS6_CAEBR|nr:Protein CBG25976 [Caenorhabditis briggsae]CAS00506.1 Protein CBG25976 [Caenorhabditis briggsae]
MSFHCSLLLKKYIKVLSDHFGRKKGVKRRADYENGPEKLNEKIKRWANKKDEEEEKFNSMISSDELVGGNTQGVDNCQVIVVGHWKFGSNRMMAMFTELLLIGTLLDQFNENKKSKKKKGVYCFNDLWTRCLMG